MSQLSNEISQRDSEINRNLSFFSSEIALATKADGAAMKTIALVTLTFLPATFVTVSSFLHQILTQSLRPSHSRLYSLILLHSSLGLVAKNDQKQTGPARNEPFRLHARHS